MASQPTNIKYIELNHPKLHQNQQHQYHRSRRIHLCLIFAVVLTLTVLGATTFFSTFRLEQSIEQDLQLNKKASTAICQLPKETGPCKGYMEVFHYDSTDNKCKMFVYGGCRGNANRFMSQTDCEKSCLKI